MPGSPGALAVTQLTSCEIFLRPAARRIRSGNAGQRHEGTPGPAAKGWHVRGPAMLSLAEILTATSASAGGM